MYLCVLLSTCLACDESPNIVLTQFFLDCLLLEMIHLSICNRPLGKDTEREIS